MIPVHHQEKNQDALEELGKALTTIILWFKSWGLKVNEEKTEKAIFYKTNCNRADVQINGNNVRTKSTIKVLRIMMDTTLTWHDHITNTVNNVQSKIHAIRRIQRYFLNDELLQLLNTYCYPSLYYASNVWLTLLLNANLKSKLFSASVNILSIMRSTATKICIRNLQERHQKCGKTMNLQFRFMT